MIIFGCILLNLKAEYFQKISNSTIHLFSIFNSNVILCSYSIFCVPPKIMCPNCQQNEWLENAELNYLPKVTKMEDGKYVAILIMVYISNYGDVTIVCMSCNFGSLTDFFDNFQNLQLI